MNIKISRRAQRDLERINRWWLAHRDERDLFIIELTEADARLPLAPEGEVWRTRGARVLRRLLLPRTQHHLYYEYRAEERTVIVLAVWSAVRGTSPRL